MERAKKGTVQVYFHNRYGFRKILKKIYCDCSTESKIIKKNNKKVFKSFSKNNTGQLSNGTYKS